jgi:hypothetical protein
MKLSKLIILTCMSVLFVACAEQKPHADQSVSFVEPADGATVESPFKVKFGVAGMAVQPAGNIAPNVGHHHLLIDSDGIKTGESVPFDAQHMHFGKGQTETMLTLPPGKHKLTLQFADGAHQSYGSAMSNSITVNVK